MLQITEVCLSLPVSNAWPERSAPAIKRIKSRMSSRIKCDMLEALMQISINCPKVKEYNSDVKETVQEWLRQKPRKLAKVNTATSNHNTPAVPVSGAAVQVEIGPTTKDCCINLRYNRVYACGGVVHSLRMVENLSFIFG